LLGHGTHVAGNISSAGIAQFPSTRGVAFGLSHIIGAKISCGQRPAFDSYALNGACLDKSLRFSFSALKFVPLCLPLPKAEMIVIISLGPNECENLPVRR